MVLSGRKKGRGAESAPAVSVPAEGFSRNLFQNALLLTLSVLTAALLRCGDPYNFPPSGWVIAAFPPEAYHRIACGDDTVFFTSHNKIVKFERGEFLDVYIAPTGVFFYDIAFWGSRGWAAGQDGEGGPYFVKYDGARWREVEVPREEIEYAFQQIIPAAQDRCWLTGGPYLYFWDGSAFKKVVGIRDVAGGVYDRARGILYCFIYRDKVYLAITADGGKNWGWEGVPEEVSGHKVTIMSYDASREGLYIMTVAEIFKRTGPPGSGEYELVFYSPRSEHFFDLKTIAFNGPAYGVAVGERTSVVYKAPEWALEQSLGYNLSSVAADPRSGFWATGGFDGLYLLFYRYQP